ncbi:MAG: NACHT domain-containing protein, partial [Oscillatoria sp. PMC 1076.18]|nr:NACHT domain-containing protein [Oscillatoria sp. PMC 1076.18]
MLDLIINAICAVARPSALLREAAERQEIVIKLLKQFNLDPEHPPADFTGVYQYALVEYGVGKPKQILELFRQNEIRQAFRQAYDRNQPSILVREVEEFLRSYALGNEIRNLGIDSRRELAAFAVIFDEIAKRTRNPAEVRRDRQIENLQRRLAAIQSTLNRLPTVEGIRTEIARLASQTYPPLTAAENPSQTFALAQQMRGWFETLKYHFETYEIATDTYFEWIINIPARRGCDRILVRGIIGEIGINDLETLRQTVATQRTDEGWLVTSRRISRAARNATETIENRHLFCYTFDELLDEQADFSRYFQWLEKEVKQRKIDQLYVPLACTKAEIDPQTKQKIAVSRYEEEDGWIDGYIDLWLDDPVKEHLSILGEFGTGKTWFAFHYAWTSLQKYLQAKKRGRQRPRIPIIIPLRDYATAVTVESLFSEFFFRKHEIRLPGYSVFQQLNSMGKLLLIFDGFDEMADKIDRQKMANNFWELASAITPGAKAILTCRTEHFPEAKQGRALLNAEIPASTSALTGEPPQFEILELEPFNDEQIRQVLSFSAQPETVAKVINNPQLLDLARRPVMIDLILEALPEIEAGKPIDIARIYLYAVHRKMARDITTKRTFTSLADKLYFLCELSWEMLANEQMSLHYRLFPDRIRRLFGSKVQAETDLDHWHHDMMGQTMLVRDAEGNYKPAHRSLLEFFVAYKFAAELGILAADFAEIADLAYFTSEANLRETFGKAPLTKAVLDLILPMLEPKETTKQRLLKIITATKGKTEDEVGYIGGNAVTLLLKTHPSALENQDFSRTVILGTDFTQANLHNLNFTQANLAKSIFPRIVGSVFSVVFSPDNKLFATAHSQGEVRLWRVSDYQQISVFEGHTGWVERVVFSPDSKTLFSCSSDKTIKVWNLYNGYCLQTLLGHKDTVNSIKISLDGKILASCSNDRTIKLWDLQTGKCFNTFEGHTDKVLELVFSSKNDMIVSCSYDKTIKIWEFFTGECLQTLSGHSDKVRSVTLSADDKIIASSGHDKTIKIWSFSTGECLRTLTGHTDTVNSVIINLDNN